MTLFGLNKVRILRTKQHTSTKKSRSSPGFTVYNLFLLFQGVIKVRKRVTLMVLIISFIFGVCWLTDSANYFAYYFFSYPAFLPYAASNTMILFNSAINPVVYALVNLRFRQKVTGMLCGNCYKASSTVHPSRGTYEMEVTSGRIQETEEVCTG